MTMTEPFRILLFAGIRDAAGIDVVEIDLDPSARVSDLLGAIAAKIPQPAPLIQVSRLAIDGQYVAPEHVIGHPHSELALIPPVSGG